MIRRAFGVSLLVAVAAVMIGGGVVLIDTGVIKGHELVIILSFGVALVAAAKPQTAPRRPPPTRDAWDGGFQDMDSASHHMAKKDH